MYKSIFLFLLFLVQKLKKIYFPVISSSNVIVVLPNLQIIINLECRTVNGPEICGVDNGSHRPVLDADLMHLQFPRAYTSVIVCAWLI